MGEEGPNSTEFRDMIEVSTSVIMSQLDDRALDSVSKALIFQYSPWPHIENRNVNRDRLVDVSNLTNEPNLGNFIIWSIRYWIIIW